MISGLTIGIEGRWLCHIDFHEGQEMEFHEWFVPTEMLKPKIKLHILEL